MSKGRRKRKYVLRFCLALFFLAILTCAGILIHRYQQEEEAKKAVTKFLEAYQRADEQACGNLLYNNFSNAPLEFSDTERALAAGVLGEAGKCGWEADAACVTIEVENIDFRQAFEALLAVQEEVTEEELNRCILQAQEEKAYRRTYQCQVFVYKTAGEWKICMSEELSNALHGGLNEYVEAAVNGEVNE